ncbi:hypothetical protein EUTSA_v10016109mg [Eutrema salsugineum]|uniref:Uncharacterized protein n=1 Tax=Eutrema salsugineum TaxID=72664 RepID=V4KVT0_EUTSA|nr:hypothetical protein EUTSA_v10016109mg [Eutrema salsugineum]
MINNNRWKQVRIKNDMEENKKDYLSYNSQSKGGSSFDTRLYSWRIHYLLIDIQYIKCNCKLSTLRIIPRTKQELNLGF